MNKVVAIEAMAVFASSNSALSLAISRSMKFARVAWEDSTSDERGGKGELEGVLRNTFRMLSGPIPSSHTNCQWRIGVECVKGLLVDATWRQVGHWTD